MLKIFAFPILCRLVFVSFVFSSIAFPVYAKLKIAYIDIPPFAWQDTQKQAQGKVIDKFKMLFDELEIEYEFVHLPHRRLVNFIERGDIDVWFGQSVTLVRHGMALTSQLPLAPMELQAFWRTGQQVIAQFSDLSGKSLIMVSAYSYGGNSKTLSKEASKVVYAVDHAEGFDLLFRNSGSYFLGYRDIADNIKGKYDIADFERQSLAKYHLYLKLRKNLPDAASMMQRINAVLEKSLL